MDVRSDKTFQVTTPTDREIVLTRMFNAPRAAVFEAWTRADHVTQWWDPSGVPLAVCEIDLRTGGAFRWVNQAGPEQSFAGTYREITAPERLVFTVRMLQPGHEPVTTLLFGEDGDRTRLTMRIECKSIEDRDALLRMRIDEGTSHTLENLAGYLDRVLKVLH